MCFSPSRSCVTTSASTCKYSNYSWQWNIDFERNDLDGARRSEELTHFNSSRSLPPVAQFKLTVSPSFWLGIIVSMYEWCLGLSDENQPHWWLFIFPSLCLKYNIGDKAPTKAMCCQESHEPAWHAPLTAAQFSLNLDRQKPDKKKCTSSTGQTVLSGRLSGRYDRPETEKDKHQLRDHNPTIESGSTNLATTENRTECQFCPQQRTGKEQHFLPHCSLCEVKQPKFFTKIKLKFNIYFQNKNWQHWI